MGRATWPNKGMPRIWPAIATRCSAYSGGRNVRGKDHVVGRLLARLAHLSGRQPNQRMEPVHHAGQPAQQVHQAVAAADMPQLVQQHAALGLLGPCGTLHGNENHRPAQAPSHRNRHLRALPHFDRPATTARSEQLLQDVTPMRIGGRLGTPGNIPRPHDADWPAKRDPKRFPRPRRQQEASTRTTCDEPR